MTQNFFAKTVGRRSLARTRRLGTLAAAVTAATTAATIGAAVAAATPGAADVSGEGFCSFEMSPPKLIELPGGGKAVSSTINPTGCTGDYVSPRSATICVSTPDGPGKCSNAPGYATGEVFVTATRYTGTFTATGRGCWAVVNIPRGDVCTPLAPISSTF